MKTRHRAGMSAICVLLGAAVLTTAAGAESGALADPASRRVQVDVNWSITQLCRNSDDTFKAAYRLKGKATGEPKPKTVKVTYRVIDLDMRSTVLNDSVTLKRPRYSATGSQALYRMSGTYRIRSVVRIRRPGNKKAAVKRSSFDVTMPEASEFEGSSVPACV